MMFRYGKIIESNNKTSRSDRFAEMSKQQQLIESKKQEIKAKFEERKRQEEAESTPKTGHRSGSDPKNNKDHKTLTSSRMQSWKKDDRWRKKQNQNETSESATNNYFSNDGSFFEKYRQMAHMKPPESSETSEASHSNCDFDNQAPEHATRNESQHFGHSHSIDKNVMPHTKFGDCSEGIPYPPPNMSMLPVSSGLAVTSQAQSLYSLTSRPPPSAPPPTIHTSLAAVPASVPLLSAVASSGPSLQTVSLIQVPVSVPASSVILSCPIETTLVSSEPVVHLPVVHSTLSHGSISVPLQTTVIPAQIQITSQAAMPPSAVQTVQINQSSTNVILSQTLQPQSILVSECIQQPAISRALPNTNVPPPMLSAPPSQPPASVFSSVPPYRMSQPATPDPTTLPPVHLPPPNYNPMAAHRTEPEMRGGVSSPATNCKTHLCNKETDGFYDERSLITSESDEHQRPFKSRDDGHDNRGDNSRSNLEDMEAVARVVADCGDEMENVLLSKCTDDDRLRFLRDKQSPPYIAFRNMVEKLRRERKIGGSRETSQSESRNDSNNDSGRRSRVPADEGDSDPEETEERRRRRRKRRSRWAPEDTKVELPAAVSVDPTIGIAIPAALGTVVPVKPPTQTPKLSGVSGPMISQVTRTDPALLQYAMKSFGTINLSEEDWKKAEDHYKINLLYQDMLKKRQELERLRAAGKHKYAYDSDEDTKGGTWEHKLRTQEMAATQLWADELTEKAKGKHHIGDFLPPDELERFMEKYNALKQGREPDLSDYKEFKLREDNIGFQMLQKLGWSEGQGLGSDGSGIVNPVNKAPSYNTSHGLGLEKPDDVTGHDDEYDAYRKRMMLAYRFRPNPLNNPRRPYY